MKKVFLIIFILVGAMYGMQAQDTKKESRTIGSFTGLSVAGNIDVILTEGSSEQMEIEATNIELSKIISEVKENTLHIYTENHNGGKKKDWEEMKALNWKNNNNQKIKVMLTYKSLEKIQAMGASDVIAKSTIKAENLVINVSGASDFKGAVNAENLHLKATGSSDIKITGNTKKQKIEASGASDVSAYELESEETEVRVSGSSDAKVYAKNTLKAQASGASDIHYKGNPELKEARASGSSDIIRSKK